MTIQYWRSLYGSLDIEVAEGMPKGLKPTGELITGYEIAYGFKLPIDYCDFIRVFGPGELGQEFRIRAPGYPSLGEPVDLAAFNASFDPLRHDESILRFYGRREQIKRLHFFASTSGSEAIAWDPDDVRDPDRHEYGIYILMHDLNSPELLASSFERFVFDVCLGNGYFRLRTEDARWDTAERGNQRVFWPGIDAYC
jgi:hypothetical protein